MVVRMVRNDAILPFRRDFGRLLYRPNRQTGLSGQLWRFQVFYPCVEGGETYFSVASPETG